MKLSFVYFVINGVSFRVRKEHITQKQTHPHPTKVHRPAGTVRLGGGPSQSARKPGVICVNHTGGTSRTSLRKHTLRAKTET
jgi:hypothetical protein